MSTAYPPRAQQPRPAKFSTSAADLDLHRLASWSYQAGQRDFFSSPPRSSSPPWTPPYSTKQAYNHAHIRSSSPLSPRVQLRTSADEFQEPHATWYGHPTPPVHLKTRLQRPASLAHQSGYTRFNASSDFDASDYSEGLETDFDDIRSDVSTRTHYRPLSPLPDSHDDGADEGPGFSFSELGIRSMCFRTSAERGRWKTDPLPFERSLVLLTRKSAPVNDSTTDVLIAPRLVSEPAPSIPASVESAKLSEQEEKAPEVISDPSSAPLSSLSTSPVLDLVDTLPSLTSDRDSSMDAEEALTPSSPLPPSSPPPFSPAASVERLPAISILSTRSIPPSPIIAPSSPLSPISSEIGEEDAQILALTTEPITTQETGDNLRLDEVGAILDLASIPKLQGHASSAPSPQDFIELNSSESRAQAVGSCLEPLPSSSSEVIEQLPENLFSLAAQISADQDKASTCPGDCPPQSPPKIANLVPHRPTDDDEVLHSSDPALDADFTITSNKRLADSFDSTLDDGHERKRMKFSDGKSEITYSPNTDEFHEETKLSAEVKKPHTDPTTSERTSSTASKRRKRKPKYVVEESDSESSVESSSSRPASPIPPRLVYSDGIWRDRNGISEEDAEICGMIIEGMATSRASSLPISQICKIILQSRPSMKAERDEKEWRDVFCRILQSGVAGQGSGVFGKVDSSYKDENKPAAEARWFYVPEMDCDQERATLIRSMMPRPGKRSVTKKYKQYYYQPLEKISRWDPEDDL
ncbi:hypothetical protein AGABI1DRAFT_109333 [Agaricus bisporus var. burnettii JB137-S8]|uniref:Uncharacterized protein n=1 Tax=Agaricus bisporus var. burnettii (strain JB137-S8 / ATCC MYA-4627 / FGSC 10392) TaxID=597362 RepID=K5WJY8_AGABU|nr:uncharacterized protein AGABI1DRAFT_109333 [Agaricus bisporus var. burnettii JB137-S8]EKM75576.1 hypothetical protein AGABI1DRAFT_109333 [Agaricus bisporus var. burnettii JB137-S8]